MNQCAHDDINSIIKSYDMIKWNAIGDKSKKKPTEEKRRKNNKSVHICRVFMSIKRFTF